MNAWSERRRPRSCDARGRHTPRSAVQNRRDCTRRRFHLGPRPSLRHHTGLTRIRTRSCHHRKSCTWRLLASQPSASACTARRDQTGPNEFLHVLPLVETCAGLQHSPTVSTKNDASVTESFDLIEIQRNWSSPLAKWKPPGYRAPKADDSPSQPIPSHRIPPRSRGHRPLERGSIESTQIETLRTWWSMLGGSRWPPPVSRVCPSFNINTIRV